MSSFAITAIKMTVVLPAVENRSTGWETSLIIQYTSR